MTKNSTTWTNVTGIWHHGKTKTIRVPIALADKILEYARTIDEAPSSTTSHNCFNIQENLTPQKSEVFQLLFDFIQIKRKQSPSYRDYPDQAFRDRPTWMVFNEFYRWVQHKARFV